METSPSRNLAARAAGWSARHWKRATFGWLLFVALAVFVGGWVGSRALTEAQMGSGEAGRAERILASAGFNSPASESVLVQNRELKATNPSFQSAIAVVVQTVALQENVTNIRNPLETPATQISPDGHSALIQFDIRGKREDSQDRVEPIMDAVATAQHANPSFRIEEFGYASANHVLSHVYDEDFANAEKLSIPFTLVVLLLAFGSLIAAGIPVLLAFSAVLAAIGLNEIISHLVPAADAASAVVLLVGMAVGVDYSLFYLRREREERAAGLEPAEALERAAATSGLAVLISGGTVVIAMAGMFLAGHGIFTSMALAAIIVVFVAMVGSLSVLPALLHRLGDKVERGRVPFLGRLRKPAGESRIWGAILRPVLRRPAVAVVIAGGALLLATAPVLGMHTKLPSITDLPHSLPLVRSYQHIQKAFPGSQTPVEVVVQAPDVTTPAYQRTYREFRARALGTGVLFQPFHVFVNPAKTVARVELSIAGKGDDAASYAALHTLREDVIAPLTPRLPGATVAVTGQTAGTFDFNELMKSRAPLVIGFVLALAFLLLLVIFRSVVIPLTAIVLNLLSVGAAYGILIMIFQWGHLQGPLDYRSNHAITAWLPLFLFVILFGLSMDYHVFIISRIKELHDRGLSTEQAVERGIRRTAGTVTAAAIVMVAVFGIFAGLREIDIKQMGVGLALAILIDATVIRAVLLPATMKLLGEWNWFLPRWLHRLPEGVLGGGQSEHERLGKPAGVAAVRDPSRVDAGNPEPIRGTSPVVDLHAAVGVRDGRVDPHT
jgi:RND superfamily putative drug exporter